MIGTTRQPTPGKSPNDAIYPSVLDICKHFKEQSSKFIRNAYEVEHNKNRSDSGRLTTSLAEDVLSLMRSETTILYDFVVTNESPSPGKNNSLLLIDCFCHLLQQVKQAQTNNRIFFMTTFEDTCAAANDFYRLSDGIETLVQELSDRLSDKSCSEGLAMFQNEGNKAVELLSQDAVMAAERTQVFVMRSVQRTSIATDYFCKAWEDDWTQNEVTISLLDIFSDYLPRAKRYLAYEYLYHKALAIAAKAISCFYVRCLVNKAYTVTKKRNLHQRFHVPGGDLHCLPFKTHSRAMSRIADDIYMMKEYMHENAAGDNTLLRVISNEIYILELILECLCAEDTASLESFIVVLHKRTGADPLVTRYFVGDLGVLTSHKQGRKLIHQAVKQLEPDLQMVTARLQECTIVHESDESFVQLEDMLKSLYEDRAAQGILPACWACLPKIEGDGGHHQMVTKQIRTWAWKVENLKNNVSKHGKR